MNTSTIARSAVVAVGIILAVGAVGGALGIGVTLPGAPSVADDGAADTQNETTENESTVTPNQTIEAMRAAENQTNGTVVGAQLGGQGESGFERSTFVYEFDVLADNGTRLVAEVYATNATVIGVETGNESDGFFEGLFESEGVSDDARNASSLRSAAGAVELAVNETDAERSNQSVTKVELGTQNGTLVYTVSILQPGGESSEIVVAANESEGGVVTTDPQKREI